MNHETKFHKFYFFIIRKSLFAADGKEGTSDGRGVNADTKDWPFLALVEFLKSEGFKFEFRQRFKKTEGLKSIKYYIL